jgi:DNA-binding XRE family transcriptional regulator
MKPDKQKRFEAAGFKVGTADDFLKLTAAESELVTLRLSLAHDVRRRRIARHFTQADLARRLGSSQSRIAKLEAAEPDVSLDLLFRAMFATGAKRSEVGRVIAAV